MSEAGTFGGTGPLFREDKDWITVDYAKHRIRPWCVEEVCFFCHQRATHKVREDSSGFGHPYTAYVCCGHFFGHCG